MYDAETTTGPASDEPTWEISPLGRRVRVLFGDQLIVDSEHTLRLVEDPHEVRYYFPKSSVRAKHLRDPQSVPDLAGRGPATLWTVIAGDKEAQNGVWSYEKPAPGRPGLCGHIAFAWHAMDRMFEEDEEVSVHPRNPYVRVDVFRSNRRVRIELKGEVLAESSRPLLLAETGRPRRWYLPRADVHAQMATSDTRAECPYKGLALYYSVEAGGVRNDDLAWAYSNPRDPAVLVVADCVCFYAEQVDTYVDGRLEERPEHQDEPLHLVGDWVRATG